MTDNENMINAESIWQPFRKGDFVKTPDGREWTVCYWFLDGVGGIQGRIDLSDTPDEQLPAPEVMFREPYAGADLPCVGSLLEYADPQ